MAFKHTPPPKRDRTGEFDSFVPRGGGPRAIMAMGLKDGLKGMGYHPITPPKIDKRVRKRQSIRDSARGEACLMLLPGCPREPDRTIWSHNRHQRAGKGGAMKALDLLGCYACTHCDAVYDGQKPVPDGLTREMVELAWYWAHDASIVKLAQKGLL